MGRGLTHITGTQPDVQSYYVLICTIKIVVKLHQLFKSNMTRFSLVYWWVFFLFVLHVVYILYWFSGVFFDAFFLGGGVAVLFLFIYYTLFNICSYAFRDVEKVKFSKISLCHFLLIYLLSNHYSLTLPNYAGYKNWIPDFIFLNIFNLQSVN